MKHALWGKRGKRKEEEREGEGKKEKERERYLTIFNQIYVTIFSAGPQPALTGKAHFLVGYHILRINNIVDKQTQDLCIHGKDGKTEEHNEVKELRKKK